MTEIALKNCPQCATEKNRSQFGKDRSRRDGLACWCRDCLRAHRRRWHADNREKSLAQIKQSRIRNPPNRALEVARVAEWAKNNPERRRVHVKTCKHRRRSQTNGWIPSSKLSAWEGAQAKVCHWCEVECDTYHLDHRVPLARGGEHSLRNLVISCPACNRRKGARCPIEFAQSMGRLL